MCGALGQRWFSQPHNSHASQESPKILANRSCLKALRDLARHEARSEKQGVISPRGLLLLEGWATKGLRSTLRTSDEGGGADGDAGGEGRRAAHGHALEGSAEGGHFREFGEYRWRLLEAR